TSPLFIEKHENQWKTVSGFFNRGASRSILFFSHASHLSAACKVLIERRNKNINLNACTSPLPLRRPSQVCTAYRKNHAGLREHQATRQIWAALPELSSSPL